MQLIKPEEITNPKVDELSMMTYLSQFPKAKLKPGAPLRPRLNPNRVRAYGPGLEPKGNQVGAPARFTVETFSAGKGTLEVTVLNPKGKKETVSVLGWGKHVVRGRAGKNSRGGGERQGDIGRGKTNSL